MMGFWLKGTLQVSDSEFVRFISFSPEKIDAFQTAERTKSPVKLADVLVAPKRGSKEVTINRRSIVTVSRNLSFERSTEIPSSSSETIKLKDATEPNLMGNMQLSSTSSTRITHITEMQEVREQEPVIRLEELKGSVICCSIKTVVKCINCSKQIEHPSNVTIVRCDSCNAKQKICAINQSKVVNLQVMDATDSMRKFVVFNKEFSEFINLHNLQQKNNEEIGNFILNRSEIKICHHENSDIVQKLE